MLWILVIVVVVLWLLGLTFDAAGGLIRLLLIAAIIALVFNLVTGRRRAL